MRKNGAVLVALLIIACAAVPRLPAAPASTAFLARLSTTVESRMERDTVPGVVIAVLKQGKPIWTQAFGMADPAQGRPMRVDALFRVESISKPVTAWLAMYLAESGRLDLDGPVAECLTRWRLPATLASMTARQLLSHTAGIGLGDFSARYPPDEPRPSLVEHIEEDFSTVAFPGQRFVYSDTGFNLLELVIEDCVSEDFGYLIRRDVLVPLGMRQASFDWTDRQMPVGHDLRGRPVSPYVYPARASGGMLATVADIARFASMELTSDRQRLLPAERIAEMHRPIVSVGGVLGFAAEGYALGHFTETLSDGRAAVWHGGQGHGWMSHIHLVPETGDGIVVLSNSQRAWPLFAAILREWSAELRVTPVGMTRVLWAEIAARAAISVCMLTAAVAIWAAVSGARVHRSVRVGACLGAAALVAWPVWASSRQYLFLFSILPGLWAWIAMASALSGSAMLILVVVDRYRSRDNS